MQKGAKPLKPSVKPRLHERKALQDLSNTLSAQKGLQDLSNTFKKKSILKERPALCSHETINNPLKILTVEETCHDGLRMCSKSLTSQEMIQRSWTSTCKKNVIKHSSWLKTLLLMMSLTSTHFWTTIL